MAKKVIRCTLSPDSIDKAIAELERYKNDLKRKCNTLARRLAEMGALKASMIYSTAVYDGTNDITISVVRRGKGYVIKANGQSVLFVEFGAGVTYGYGHPMASELGYGAGTYPGKGHWNNPQGWWYPTDNAGDSVKVSKKSGQAYAHTYGNPPNMAMYNTAKDLRDEIERVAREVFT